MNQSLTTRVIKQIAAYEDFHHRLLVVLTVILLLPLTVNLPGAPVSSGEGSRSPVQNSQVEGSSEWDAAFSPVQIPSTVDGVLQSAYFLPARNAESQPLLVSLHTWSGDYTQADPLAKQALEAGWNYIHPDFRGPNWTPEACVSTKALHDIDDAIQYAIDNGSVDRDRIFVVGVSGGGYATLGAYLRTRHRVRAWLAWVPISDLVAWFHQSRNRENRYAQDIIDCTSGGEDFDEEEATKRSPLYWDFPPHRSGQIEIYAGLNDGYSGSVPISHSILFFNKIAERHRDQEARVKKEDIVRLLTRGIDRRRSFRKIGNRDLVFEEQTKGASLIIFDGEHEMLADWCFERLKELARE